MALGANGSIGHCVLERVATVASVGYEHAITLLRYTVDRSALLTMEVMG